MNTSARPDSTSRSRSAGRDTASTEARTSVRRISGSMNVPFCTTTTRPGWSMSAHDLIARLAREAIA